MPQRRPPLYPLPQGLICRHATSGMVAGQPLVEWAYQTPSNAGGVPASALPYLSKAEQAEVVGSWFLANYKPRWPGPFFGFATQGAEPGRAMLGGGLFAPPSWPTVIIIDDEFGLLLPDDVRASLAAELHARSTAWTLIPDQIPSAVLDLSQATNADLPEIERRRLPDWSE